MTFRTVHQDECPQIEKAAGSYNSVYPVYQRIIPALYAYEVCSYLNLIYKQIHSIASMPDYYSLHATENDEMSILSTLSVLSYNLSYELNRLEKVKEDREPWGFNKAYRHYFDTIIEELEAFKDAVEQDSSIESDYIITMVEFLDKLILKGFAELTKAYPEHGFYIKK